MEQMPEYRLVNLPDGIPPCMMKPRPSSSAAFGGGGVSNFSFGKSSQSSKSDSKARGFDPTKALRGAAPSNREAEANESACTSRGDGLFEGGAAFRKDGNKVIMAPGAFTEENAMQTLEELDRLDRQQLVGRRKSPPAPEQQGKLLAEKSMSCLDQKEVEGIYDLLNMVTPGSETLTSSRTDSLDSGSLFDIRDDSDGTGQRSSTTGVSRPAVHGAQVRVVGETPKWAVTQKVKTAKCPYKHLQVDVELPSIESIQEVDLMVGENVVRLTAGAIYSLEAELPCRVTDKNSEAKWSKTKKRLTLLLPVV